MDNINYFGWKFGIEFEIVLTNEGELNVDESFLHFSVKKKCMQELLSI